ncbi:hypothetical protein GCM10011397_22670 [Wenyingzhuangia marina]|nr:hypothetical protein GCM10011397_22670 [Wenyingzhuangia marina]
MSLLIQTNIDMKKTMTILAILITFTGFSQEKISSYSSTYLDGKEFDINASKGKKEGDYTYYIDVYSRESYTKSIALSIDIKDIDKFTTSLSMAKDKLSTWSKTAIENNVTSLDKTMEHIKFNSPVAFYYGSKWQFDFSVNYLFRAKIIDGQMYLIIQNKNELVSSSNQFMDTKGFLLVFSSVDEIDEFVKALDKQKVIQHFNVQENTEELFN